MFLLIKKHVKYLQWVLYLQHEKLHFVRLILLDVMRVMK